MGSSFTVSFRQPVYLLVRNMGCGGQIELLYGTWVWSRKKSVTKACKGDKWKKDKFADIAIDIPITKYQKLIKCRKFKMACQVNIWEYVEDYVQYCKQRGNGQVGINLASWTSHVYEARMHIGSEYWHKNKVWSPWFQVETNCMYKACQRDDYFCEEE